MKISYRQSSSRIFTRKQLCQWKINGFTDIKELILLELRGHSITISVRESFWREEARLLSRWQKNFYFDMDQTVERKIAEIFMAIAMEKEFTKEEILELYVNHIYFGDGYDCVREASLGYFQKEPGQMNDYESTLLAGIPNAPSVYAPTKNPELAKQRQQQVLETMVKNEMLTEEEQKEILTQAE